MKWFNNPRTAEELKKQYRELAVKHHPDMGGSTADMQEINNEYDMLFERLKNIHSNAEGQTYTAKDETTETPEEFKEIIEKLIHIDGINIEICGSWIWITGNTRLHKKEIKAAGCHWSKNKSAWYWHADGYKKRHKGAYTLDQIRDTYGSQKVSTTPKTAIA